MSFQSILFIVFFLAILIVLAISKKEKIRQMEILIASVMFYALWDIRFLLLIGICILVSHFSAAGIMENVKTGGRSANKRMVLVIGIAVQLAILCIFKYLKFFVMGFVRMFGGSHPGGVLNIILPIGISFYIFSAISYIVDVYRGEIKEQPPLYQEALYILFFPKLLQGPLCKAADFMEQLKKEHPIRSGNLESGVQIFLFGLIKKIVIADRLGLFVDHVYASPAVYSAGTLLLAALTYPIQLYCDFSGYSDMAVATARMMGYELCPNFNLPFLSKTVAEYWRRWHMSLNVWFRDYLFYPVIRSGWVNTLRKKIKRKSRRFSQKIPAVTGMMIVWPLIGLWHGAALNYVLYGCCYGIWMILAQFVSEKEHSRVSDFLGILRTLVITVVLLVLFRAPSVSDAGMILGRIFTLKPGIRYLYTWSFVFIPVVMLASVYSYRKNNGNGFYICMDLTRLKSKIVFTTAAVMTVVLMYVGENYFMYFQF